MSPIIDIQREPFGGKRLTLTGIFGVHSLYECRHFIDPPHYLGVESENGAEKNKIFICSGSLSMHILTLYSRRSTSHLQEDLSDLIRL